MIWPPRPVACPHATELIRWCLVRVTRTKARDDTLSTLTVSPKVTTWYRRLVVSGPCSGISNIEKVEVLESIKNNSIAPDQTICINTAANPITGSVPTGGGGGYLYVWQQSIDGGATWINIPGGNQQNYSPGILIQTTQYRRLVSTVLCSANLGLVSNILTITVRPDAKADINPTKTEDCAPFTITHDTLQHTHYPDQNSNYFWYVNNTVVGSGVTFPGYTISTPGDSILLKVLAISKFGCKNDSMEIWFKAPANPQPSFVLSDTVKCGPALISIANTTPNKEIYSFQWNFGQGQTSIQTDPAPVLFPTNPTYMDTVYTVTLKATGGCDTISYAQKIRIKSKPKALFTPNKTEGCSPMTVQFYNNSKGVNPQFVWDFGDGSPMLSSQDSIIKHTFYAGTQDTFLVRLIATNDCGSDTLSYIVIVHPNTIRIDFAINGNDLNGCAPHLVSFINNTSGANLFHWDFGDGTRATTTKGIDTLTHTYNSSGDYKVTLFATNGCSDTTDFEFVTVREKPKVLFTGLPNPACIGDSVYFTNKSDSASFLWKFGDGTSARTFNATKNYKVAGNYKVWLIGTRSYSSGLTCQDSSFLDVLITDTLPTIMYVSDSIGNCAPFTVVFTNPILNASKVYWDFGDGSNSTQFNPTHTFKEVGTYHVRMVATLASGCNYLAKKTIVVNGPTGNLVFNAGFVCLNAPVKFEVVSGNAEKYIFMFGDGDSLVSASPLVSHSYNRPGYFFPYLILQSGICRVRMEQKDTIKVDRVVAGFTQSFDQICGSTIATFTGNASGTFGIAGVSWDFGDGTRAYVNVVKKDYFTPGTYRITLVAASISGCMDTLIKNVPVPVKVIPVVNIIAATKQCAKTPALFEAFIQSRDSVTAVDWNFGNGATGSGARVYPIFATPGTYKVTVTVRTIEGCTNRDSLIVTVSPTPFVTAGTDSRVCLGQETNLRASGAETYSWTPAAGLSCNNCLAPVAKPIKTTNYIVTGFNLEGCSANDTVLVEVVQPFKITVTASDSICIGDSKQLLASGAVTYRWLPTQGLNASDIPNPIATPLNSTTYQVVGFDAYNCFTDTGYVRIGVGPVPTLELGNGALVAAGTQVTLNPVTTGGPIRNYIWTPNTLLSCNNCPNPVATINNNIIYSLRVITFYGCPAIDTIGFRVFCEADQIFIPNGFSPDGDGVNDVFYIMGKGVSRVKHFRVFNRFGQIVFEKHNFDINDPHFGWDGKINGVPASPDVYVYTADVVCTAGAEFPYKGNVILVR